jgi:hypothetical protein
MVMVVARETLHQLEQDIDRMLQGWVVLYVQDVQSLKGLTDHLKTVDLVVISRSVFLAMTTSFLVLATDQNPEWMFETPKKVVVESSTAIFRAMWDIVWDTLIIDDVDTLVLGPSISSPKKHYLDRASITLRTLLPSRRTILLSSLNMSPRHLDTYLYLLGSSTADGASLYPLALSPRDQARVPYSSCVHKATQSFQLPAIQRTKLHHLFLQHHVVRLSSSPRGQKRKTTTTEEVHTFFLFCIHILLLKNILLPVNQSPTTKTFFLDGVRRQGYGYRVLGHGRDHERRCKMSSLRPALVHL